MKRLILLTIPLALLALSSCDVVEMPIPEPTVDLGPCPDCPEVDSTELNTATTKVLVEEFTGHKCAYCPRNTRKLLAMQEANGEQIIITSIHAGETFASTEPHYPEDFTTPYGDQLHDDYQIFNFGYPSALVLRATYPDFNNTTVFVGHTGGWENPINARLNAPAVMALGVAANYSAAQSKFFIRVSARALEDLTGNYKLVVVCIEDSVIAPQKDEDSDLPEKRIVDYAHRHMVRGQVNSEAGPYGEVVISGSLLQDEWIDRTYQFDVPEKVVDPARCSIVAFVTNADTKEVIQVEEAHVQPVN